MAQGKRRFTAAHKGDGRAAGLDQQGAIGNGMARGRTGRGEAGTGPVCAKLSRQSARCRRAHGARYREGRRAWLVLSVQPQVARVFALLTAEGRPAVWHVFGLFVEGFAELIRFNDNAWQLGNVVLTVLKT
jgi:hypothetical protein